MLQYFINIVVHDIYVCSSKSFSSKLASWGSYYYYYSHFRMSEETFRAINNFSSVIISN